MTPLAPSLSLSLRRGGESWDTQVFPGGGPALMLGPALGLLLACAEEAAPRESRSEADTDADSDPPDGQALFVARCSNDNCRGADGDRGAASDLSAVVPERTDDQIESVRVDGQGDMEPQGLSREQVTAVIAYLREASP